MRPVLAWLLLAPALAAASGGRVAGTVTTLRGGRPQPARFTLVWVRGFTSPPPAAPQHSTQAGRIFDPPVLAVVRGQAVEFANDETRGFWHHVFSASVQAPFDLGRYRAPEKRRQVFYREGRVDVFCDIHKEMFQTLWVLPNDSFTLLSSDVGAVSPFALEHVPAGTFTLVVWNRAAEAPLEVPLTVEEGKTTHLDLRFELGERPLEALLADHKDARGHAYTEQNRRKEKGDW